MSLVASSALCSSSNASLSTQSLAPLEVRCLVPSHLVGVIIGINASMRVEIEHRTDCMLRFSFRNVREKTAYRVLSVKGRFSNVATAYTLIFKLLVRELMKDARMKNGQVFAPLSVPSLDLLCDEALLRQLYLRKEPGILSVFERIAKQTDIHIFFSRSRMPHSSDRVICVGVLDLSSESFESFHSAMLLLTTTMRMLWNEGIPLTSHYVPSPNDNICFDTIPVRHECINAYMQDASMDTLTSITNQVPGKGGKEEEAHGRRKSIAALWEKDEDELSSLMDEKLTREKLSSQENSIHSCTSQLGETQGYDWPTPTEVKSTRSMCMHEPIDYIKSRLRQADTDLQPSLQRDAAYVKGKEPQMFDSTRGFHSREGSLTSTCSSTSEGECSEPFKYFAQDMLEPNGQGDYASHRRRESWSDLCKPSTSAPSKRVVRADDHSVDASGFDSPSTSMSKTERRTGKLKNANYRTNETLYLGCRRSASTSSRKGTATISAEGDNEQYPSITVHLLLHQGQADALCKHRPSSIDNLGRYKRVSLRLQSHVIGEDAICSLTALSPSPRFRNHAHLKNDKMRDIMIHALCGFVKELETFMAHGKPNSNQEPLLTLLVPGTLDPSKDFQGTQEIDLQCCVQTPISIPQDKAKFLNLPSSVTPVAFNGSREHITNILSRVLEQWNK